MRLTAMHATPSILFVLVASATFVSRTSAESRNDGVLYVDDDAPPGGDGTTWASAFCYLQDALAAVRKVQGVSEIRVAQGTYKPDQGQGVTAGDSHTAFDLVNRVALRGGYAGPGELDPDQRDVTQFVTILSGDLLGNDGPNFTNYDDNAYRIVRAENLDLATLIEGVTIIASQWEPSEFLMGGGIYCPSGELTVRVCRFERNHAYYGGGIGIRAGTLVVQQCVFTHNKARYGAGMSANGPLPNAWPDVVVEDCVFTDNLADIEDGGGIVAGNNTIVRRCYFARNDADDGGAIIGSPTVEDSVFEDNRADYGGAVARGGIYTRCVFRNNRAHSVGGASASISSNPSHHARFIDCDFVANYTDVLGGGACYGGTAYVNCRFLANRSGGLGDFAPGGAIQVTIPAVIIGCTFTGNHACGAGGAVRAAFEGTTTIINSSFANNQSTTLGQAVFGSATICNSVFGSHNGAPLADILSVDYSCLPTIMAGQGNIAADPLFVNPLGPDGVAGTEDDDLRLSADSPCIDAADTTALPADQFDLDGDGDTAEPLPLDAFSNCRVLETPAVINTGIPSPTGAAVVDMGAHEYRRPADIAPDIGDGVVDVDDLITVILHWGPCEPPADPAIPPAGCIADIDGDGEVAVFDLVTVILSWG
jgi:hypothetical protein